MWQKDPYRLMCEEGKAPSIDRMGFCLACQQNDIGLIAMKPYAGWGLTLTPVRCLSCVLSRPGVSAALPGCADPKELEAALAYCDASEAEKDFSAIDVNALWKLERRCVYSCHCLPCPETINVGGLMKLLDSAWSAARSASTFRPGCSTPSRCSGHERVKKP